MRVLIALDESRHSDLAFASVMLRAWPRNTKFLLCFVMEDVMSSAAYFQLRSTAPLQKLQSEMQSFAVGVLGNKVAELKRAFPEHEILWRLESGKASDRIVETALKWDADVLILGSHGRRGVQKYALGSVSESVVERAPCSVEIIRGNRYSGQTFLEQNRILICYDRSKNSDACLRWITEGCWSAMQQFVLVTVLAPLDEVIHPRWTQQRAIKRLKSKLLKEAQSILESRCSLLRSTMPSNQIEAVALEGYAAEAIIEMSDRWQPDLILLGAHNDQATNTGSLGSVARRVVAGVKCSVKLVRDKVGFAHGGVGEIIPMADLTSVQ